ncbi:MAG: hypothetical protein F9K22_12670 [Bacteroidetes bacterium]|nr:MAG: hypothetical protein F9K22_12670 [Bacteroidota bacterium]
METTHKSYLGTSNYPQFQKYGGWISTHDTETYYIGSVFDTIRVPIELRDTIDLKKNYAFALTVTVSSGVENTRFVSKAEKEFLELAAKWRKETRGYSTMLHKAMNNSYLDIIGMGEKVVPFILRDLNNELDHWFLALKHITKENPVPDADNGSPEKMRRAWIEWGKKRNLL